MAARRLICEYALAAASEQRNPCRLPTLGAFCCAPGLSHRQWQRRSHSKRLHTHDFTCTVHVWASDFTPIKNSFGVSTAIAVSSITQCEQFCPLKRVPLDYRGTCFFLLLDLSKSTLSVPAFITSKIWWFFISFVRESASIVFVSIQWTFVLPSSGGASA